MTRYTRFVAPVDPNNIEATAQAMFDALQAKLRAAELRKQGYTREWTPAELEKLVQGEMPGGFAGPDQTWPIGSAADVAAAWALAEQAGAPEEVRAGIRAVAARCGWQDALPADK